MKRPIEYIDELKRQYVNSDIDWELVLERGYRLFLDERSTVVDVGAHAGRHSDVFIDQIGVARALLFEPLPSQFEFLVSRYASRPNVAVVNQALGARPGTANFVFNHVAPEESGLLERKADDPSVRDVETIQVTVGTLDQHTLDALDYVKIDTEGGEVDILLGARETLARHRPTLSIEYGAAAYGVYGKKRSTLFDLSVELDYVLFDLFGHPIPTASDWDECADNYYWDYYAVPSERARAFEALLAPQIYAQVPNCLHAR